MGVGDGDGEDAPLPTHTATVLHTLLLCLSCSMSFQQEERNSERWGQKNTTKQEEEWESWEEKIGCECVVN